MAISEKTRHILLVEDEAPHVELIRRAFASNASSIRLLVASNLQEARQHLAAATPDLLIADLRLTDGDALELLLVDENVASYPVVILTAQGDERVAVEAMKAGALDYVVKSEIAFAEMPHIAERALREWRNIVARKRTEEALRVRTERYELIASGTCDGIWDWDVPNHRVYYSPRWKEMRGFAQDELSDREEERISRIHPDDAPRVMAAVQAYFDRQTAVFQEEYRVRCKDGSFKWILDRGVARWDADGNVVRMAGSESDISERKRIEEKAHQHEAELAHFGRLSTLGEMAAGLAHELNQPLSAIMNRAETCLAHADATGQDAAKLRSNIGEIITQTERASQIIRRLRDFVRRKKPRTSSTCINTLIREVHEFVAAEARHKKVAIRLELADDLSAVSADSIQIEQVVLNLIRNALEAMDDSSRRERRLTIQTSSSGDDLLEISVSDTGPGLAPDSMHRIFDAFFTTKPDGMGMGLSISRTIIEAHGGRLWASSNPGAGATFHFSLPVQKRSKIAPTALRK